MRNRYAKGSEQAMAGQQKTREKLIDAMEEALRIYGYQGTSLSALLKTLHIPKGSMYHYFASKKELVLCVIAERLKPRMERHFLFVERSGRHALDAVIERLESCKSDESLSRERALFLPLLIETAAVDKEIHRALEALYREIFRSLRTLLEEAQKRGEIEPIDSEALSHYILTLLFGSLTLRQAAFESTDAVKNITLLQEYLRAMKLSRKERPKHIQQTLF